MIRAPHAAESARCAGSAPGWAVTRRRALRGGGSGALAKRWPPPAPGPLLAAQEAEGDAPPQTAVFPVASVPRKCPRVGRRGAGGSGAPQA